jgi:hypothetical protein
MVSTAAGVIVVNPQNMGWMDIAKAYWANKAGLMEPYRQQQAAQQVRGLLGQPASPYQADIMEGEEAPIQGLQNEGRGLLGSISDPQQQKLAKFYGGLLTVPGYGNVGAQGIADLFGAKAKDNLFAKIDPANFTRPSIAQFQSSGNYADLMPIDEDGEQSEAQESYKTEKELRDEFDKHSKQFIDLTTSLKKIDRTARMGTAAGDMTMIFNFMKMQDPGSSVREGEYANAQNAAGWGEQIRNLYNKAKDGQILTPEQRADFVESANQVYMGALESQTKNMQRYGELASSYGTEPTRVVTDFSTPLSSFNFDQSGLSKEEEDELASLRRQLKGAK